MKQLFLKSAITFILLVTLGCNNSDDESISLLEANGLTKEINNLVPEDILTEMIALGMVINTGDNPPSLENSYLISPYILKNSNISKDIIGSKYADAYIKLSNQNNKTLTVKLYKSQASAISKGIGSFVVGNNNNFSVFSEIEITYENYTAMGVTVFSGTLVADGIENIIVALFMVDDKGDPNNYFIENGQGRIFKDADGFSESGVSFKHIFIKDKKRRSSPSLLK